MIVSKQPLSAPWQLPVIGLPLVLLLLIVKCSNNHPTLQYRKDDFVDIHSCNGNGAALGQQQLQWQWGNGDGDDRSIDCNGAIAIALGQGQQEQQEARATGAMGQQRSHCHRCGRGAWGAGVGVFFRVFYSKTLVNAQMEV
jgi:hypothetical protein